MENVWLMFWLGMGFIVLMMVLVLVNERKRGDRKEEMMRFWKKVVYLKVRIRGIKGFIKEERERSGEWENEVIMSWKKVKKEVVDELIRLYKCVGVDYSIVDLD